MNSLARSNCKHLVPWDAADQRLHLAIPVMKK